MSLRNLTALQRAHARAGGDRMPFDLLKRREFITLLGGAAAAWPLAARAQQRLAPVIGFLHAGSPNSQVAAFPQTLAEAGLVDKQNVTIEYRYAEGQYDRLAGLAADLVRQKVTVIIASPNTDSARAAKAATSVIPIVFMVSIDPVKLGLVASLNRPGGNATGVNYFISELGAKRLGLLRDLLPTAMHVGAMVNPNAATTEGFIKDVTSAASTLGIQVEIARARNSEEIKAAFAALASSKVDAVMVAPDTLFATTVRSQITGLAAQYAIPAIYTVREYARDGGLISYGPSVPDAYRQVAMYASRIINGANPAELPVVQSTKFEFVINLRTAKSLGLTVPDRLLVLADEVIE
jgi:putative ABC transport system substrate-binding protein